MDTKRVVELYRWEDDLRIKLSLVEVIEVVRNRIKTADCLDEYQLTLILKGLLIEAGRDLEAAHIIDEMICRHPDDVRFPISKATLNLYFLNDPEEALKSIDEALARAHRTGFFRREALGVKARILLKLGREKQLAQTLEKIMGLEMKDGIPDVGRERDFVDQAPVGLIPADIRIRYEAFCPKSSLARE